MYLKSVRILYVILLCIIFIGGSLFYLLPNDNFGVHATADRESMIEEAERTVEIEISNPFPKRGDCVRVSEKTRAR